MLLFKKFFDRTWSQVEVDFEKEQPYTSRLPHGKTAIFILCQADVEEKHIDIVERYTEIFHLYGYDLRVIRATGLMSGTSDGDVSTAQKKAVELANELLKYLITSIAKEVYLSSKMVKQKNDAIRPVPADGPCPGRPDPCPSAGLSISGQGKSSGSRVSRPPV